jgi:hypothetical protein
MPCHSTPGERDPGTHSRSGCSEEKNLLSLLGIEPQFPDYPTCSQVTILTELFWFHTWRVFKKKTRHTIPITNFSLMTN